MSEVGTAAAKRTSRLRRVADILLPGTPNAPAATALTNFDQLLTTAVKALGSESILLDQALRRLPETLNWDALKRFAETDRDSFELISTTVVGAYFMSLEALQSIGYRTGPRRAAPFDQAADELGSGILEPVLNRDSTLRTV